MKLATRLALIFSPLLLLASQALAAPKVFEEGRAIILGSEGKATVRGPTGSSHNGATTESPATVGASYTAGHLFSTAMGARLATVLSPGALLGLGAETQVRLEELSERPQGLPGSQSERVRRIRLSLDKGSIRFDAGDQDPNKKFQIDIGGATLNISGGSFELRREGDKWTLVVVKGEVVVTTKTGTLTLNAGSTGEMVLTDPEKPVLTRRDTVPADRLPSADTAFFDKTFAPVADAVLKGKSVDLEALTSHLGGQGNLISILGNPGVSHDVSPSSAFGGSSGIR